MHHFNSFNELAAAQVQPGLVSDMSTFNSEEGFNTILEKIKKPGFKVKVVTSRVEQAVKEIAEVKDPQLRASMKGELWAALDQLYGGQAQSMFGHIANTRASDKPLMNEMVRRVIGAGIACGYAGGADDDRIAVSLAYEVERGTACGFQRSHHHEQARQ